MVRLFLLPFAWLALAACAAPDAVSVDDGAAYLGLLPGTSLSYSAGNGVSEIHEMKDSDFLFAGGLAVGVFAKQGGFINDQRTLTLGIDLEQVSLLRLFDCQARCGSLDAPIPWLSWPLEAGQSTEGEATVSVNEPDGSTTIHTEHHTTTVSAPEQTIVAGGTFDAFVISWTRTTTALDGTQTIDNALLRLAPNSGVVKHEAFDGTVLELAP